MPAGASAAPADSDSEEGAPADTDSEEGAPASDCPLCCIEEAEVEHAGAVGGTHPLMRRIMAEELKCHGTKPKAAVYNSIARLYNRHVRRAMLGRELQCVRWTGQMVQTHFECHVTLVPRRVIARCVERVELVAKLLDTEVAGRQTAEPTENGEIIDTKIVNKVCTVAKTLKDLVRDSRAYVKEDMQERSVDKVITGVDLDAAANEGKDLLDRQALLQSAAGAGDRATASDLFD